MDEKATCNERGSLQRRFKRTTERKGGKEEERPSVVFSFLLCILSKFLDSSIPAERIEL